MLGSECTACERPQEEDLGIGLDAVMAELQKIKEEGRELSEGTTDLERSQICSKAKEKGKAKGKEGTERRDQQQQQQQLQGGRD